MCARYKRVFALYFAAVLAAMYCLFLYVVTVSCSKWREIITGLKVFLSNFLSESNGGKLHPKFLQSERAVTTG